MGSHLLVKSAPLILVIQLCITNGYKFLYNFVSSTRHDGQKHFCSPLPYPPLHHKWKELPPDFVFNITQLVNQYFELVETNLKKYIVIKVNIILQSGYELWWLDLMIKYWVINLPYIGGSSYMEIILYNQN